MAIVQISRIQNRRGRELTEVGIPQLSAAELGWAVDTQKLYIGNGSTSEGAPAVGNTELLTEHSDLLVLANQYIYKENSNLWIGIANQTAQSLRGKLDQVVTVFDFGAIGDGVVDDSVAFQAAIDSLYLQATTDTDIVALRVPAGNFRLRDTIYLPPFVRLIGDGIGKTIISTPAYGEAGLVQGPIFKTTNGDAQRGVYNPVAATEPVDSVTPTQARHIQLSGMTIIQSKIGAAIELRECARSLFTDLRFEGYIWSDITGQDNVDTSYFAIKMTDPDGNANCKENTFKDIQIDGFHTAIFSDDDNDKNLFSNVTFRDHRIGISCGGNPRSPNQPNGPSFNTIENCSFDRIEEQGILIANGEYNVSKGNKFFNVGNNLGSASSAARAAIEFTNNYTNHSSNDYFERLAELGPYRTPAGSISASATRTYVGEVVGRADYISDIRNEIPIGYTVVVLYAEDEITPIGSTDTIEILKLPLIDNGSIFLDYLYVGKDERNIGSELYVRMEGTITLHLHSNDANELVLENDFTYQGDNANIDNIVFTAAIENSEIVISCKNIIPVYTDSFTYKIRAKS